jgi:alpha-L-rhamnosidase
MTGIFRLKVHEPKGTKIHLQFGEILQNGNFYRDNLRSAKAEFIYISDGKEHVIEPKFTFYGFRFVKVEGISNLKPEDFTALVMYSEIPRTGWLTTGNSLVNQLIHNAEWGQLGNFLDVPTDCPQRDERLGWTGDAQVFAPTACYQRDCAAFYAKYLHDLYEEQKLTGGEVPVVVPSFDLNKGCSTAWGDAACIIPWTVYEYTGDKTILENQFESMRGWVDFLERLENDNHSWRKHFHFGDWLALDCPKAAKGFVGATDRAFIALTYFRYSALLTSRAAGVIGNTEAQEHYLKLADSILKEIRKEYFTPTGRCAVPTQTAYLLTLRHGLSIDTARIQKDLADKLTSNEDMLETGFVGTPLLCEELTSAGYADKAFKLLLNEEYPGWLYAVKMGATTIWERWNSVLPDGSISDTGMNSLNHYSYGSIVHWLYQDVAGIAPLAPGFKKAKLQPHVNEALGNIEARFVSASGEWRIQWKLEPDGTINYSCTVPFGCTAELILPGMEAQTFDSGEYRFAFMLPEPDKNKNGAVATPFD